MAGTFADLSNGLKWSCTKRDSRIGPPVGHGTAGDLQRLPFPSALVLGVGLRPKPGASPGGDFVTASFRRTASHLFASPGVGNTDRSAIEVEVVPRQAKVFTGSHACCQGECEQGLIGMTGDQLDECSRLFDV